VPRDFLSLQVVISGLLGRGKNIVYSRESLTFLTFPFWLFFLIKGKSTMLGRMQDQFRAEKPVFDQGPQCAISKEWIIIHVVV
jgi:hypothetical protein